MKVKRLNDIYMREVIDKEVRTIMNEELNAYITYKHIIKTSSACYNYINGKKIPIVDNGYTILEYSPKDKYYNVRIFIDDQNNILKYYFDIVDFIKYENNQIFYGDLYLDVIYDMKYSNECCDYISLIDENELKDAYYCNIISKKQYEQAYITANELMTELRDKNNVFVKRKTKDLKLFYKK